MSVKVFKISDSSVSRKVDIVTMVYFKQQLSDTELLVLAAVINYSTNNTITLTPEISKAMRNETGVSDTSFSTSLFRLEKKGLYTKAGRTIQLHPAFSNIHSMDKLSIIFPIITPT